MEYIVFDTFDVIELQTLELKDELFDGVTFDP